MVSGNFIYVNLFSFWKICWIWRREGGSYEFIMRRFTNYYYYYFILVVVIRGRGEGEREFLFLGSSCFILGKRCRDFGKRETKTEGS